MKQLLTPIYRYQLPNTTEYELNGSTVRFTNSNARLRYDFREDIQSEREVLEDICRNTDDGDIVLDVGANIGIYSCSVCTAGNKVKVIACEPDPSNIKTLEENISLNSLDNQIAIFDVAFSDKEGEIEFQHIIRGRGSVIATDSEAGKRSGESLLSLLGTEKKSQKITVDSKRGDTQLQSIGKVPNIIKIDVEGAELRVLRGLNQTLQSSQCHTVYIEIHPDKITDFGGVEEEVYSILNNKDFKMKELLSDQKNYYLKAAKR